MSLIHGFPPVAEAGARVLVLGSMPGEASLDAAQYYAHPRNAFWRIMGELVGAAPELPYEERLARLKAAGIALWDVVASCERPGSLDARIVPGSIQVNDFSGFFAVYRSIQRVYFNGSAAEVAFRRHVLPQLVHLPLIYARLPSTSPAHAARSFTDKLDAWSVVVDPNG